MKRDKSLKDYGIVENSMIYAVNGSKYLKKVKKSEA